MEKDLCVINLMLIDEKMKLIDSARDKYQLTNLKNQLNNDS